jgi:23S rRNA A2030 N6-methylase RlmJ
MGFSNTPRADRLIAEATGDDGQERIQAAIITHRGETHTGLCHNDAYEKAEKKHGIARITSAPTMPQNNTRCW